MRKYSKICSLVLVIVMMMSVLSGCGKTTYEAASGFSIAVIRVIAMVTEPRNMQLAKLYI